MRSTFVAVATAMVVVGVTPTLAAKRHHHPAPIFASERQNQATPASQSQNQPKPSYDACATLSVQRAQCLAKAAQIRRITTLRS